MQDIKDELNMLWAKLPIVGASEEAEVIARIEEIEALLRYYT